METYICINRNIFKGHPKLKIIGPYEKWVLVARTKDYVILKLLNSFNQTRVCITEDILKRYFRKVEVNKDDGDRQRN